MESPNDDRFSGLPPDLVRVLQDPRITFPMDDTLRRVLYVLDDVPCDTASALTSEQWGRLWAAEWQRANRAEVALDEIRELLAEAAKTEESLRG